MSKDKVVSKLNELMLHKKIFSIVIGSEVMLCGEYIDSIYSIVMRGMQNLTYIADWCNVNNHFVDITNSVVFELDNEFVNDLHRILHITD